MSERPRLAAVLAATAAILAGCGSRTPAEAPEPPPIAGGFFDSPEDAAAEALTLIEAGDAAGLARIALTERDFRESVYPRLPASRPERNTSADFLWEMLHQRSRNSLAMTLARHRGRRYELVAVDFHGETTDYGAFRVHRETVLTVRDPDGERAALRIFGSMLEREGRYRIFSFVTD